MNNSHCPINFKIIFNVGTTDFGNSFQIFVIYWSKNEKNITHKLLTVLPRVLRTLYENEMKLEIFRSEKL